LAGCNVIHPLAPVQFSKQNNTAMEPRIGDRLRADTSWQLGPRPEHEAPDAEMIFGILISPGRELGPEYTETCKINYIKRLERK
jgi:hypothetical protein